MTVRAGPLDRAQSPTVMRPMWAFFLAAGIVVMVGGLTVLFRGGDEFAFAEGDLCEWLSENDVTSAVRHAYAEVGIEWDGVVEGVAPRGSAWDLPGQEYCRWEPTGGGYVIARGLTPSQFEPPVEFSETDVGDGVLLRAVSGHPDVDDHVIAGSAAFGRYGFWLEGSDEVLGLEAVLQTSDETIDWMQQEKMLFSIADRFLDDMGWTSR